MIKEIYFNKYEIKSPNYHYKQIKANCWRYYNAYVHARYILELELIIITLNKIQKRSQKLKILDVGCGDAVLFYLLNKKINLEDTLLYGIDLSDTALKIAKKKNPRSIFKKANVYSLPFDDNFFDLIISSDVIEHILKPKKMLSEIFRVGKSKSFIIMGTPIRCTEIPHDKMHVHEFLPNEFNKLLSSYFRIIRLVQSHRLRYLLLYKKSCALFKREFFTYRFIIKILSIFFKKNLFLNLKTRNKEKFSHMFYIGKKWY